MGAFVSCFQFRSEGVSLRASDVAGTGLTERKAKDIRRSLDPQVDFSPLPPSPSTLRVPRSVDTLLGAMALVVFSEFVRRRSRFPFTRPASPEQPLLVTTAVSQPASGNISLAEMQFLGTEKPAPFLSA